MYMKSVLQSYIHAVTLLTHVTNAFNVELGIYEIRGPHSVLFLCEVTPYQLVNSDVYKEPRGSIFSVQQSNFYCLSLRSEHLTYLTLKMELYRSSKHQ